MAKRKGAVSIGGRFGMPMKKQQREWERNFRRNVAAAFGLSERELYDLPVETYNALIKEYVTTETSTLTEQIAASIEQMAVQNMGMPPVPNEEVQEIEDQLRFSLSGEFQGVMVHTGDIDILAGESPIEAALCAALMIQPGEELVAISIRKPDGRIEVRPWTTK